MRSMKRDHKSANVNFETVEYVVHDWWTFLKKSRPKSAKMAELRYFEIDCKKLHFEKNDFEIYEPDFWEKINFEIFYAQNYYQKMCSRSILNRPIRFWSLFYMKKGLLTLLTSFYGFNAFGCIYINMFYVFALAYHSTGFLWPTIQFFPPFCEPQARTVTRACTLHTAHAQRGYICI